MVEMEARSGGGEPFPDRPPMKIFKPKCPELRTLQDYSKDAPEDYWKAFPRNLDVGGGSPYKINTSVLRR